MKHFFWFKKLVKKKSSLCFIPELRLVLTLAFPKILISKQTDFRLISSNRPSLFFTLCPTDLTYCRSGVPRPSCVASWVLRGAGGLRVPEDKGEYQQGPGDG